VIVKRYYDIIDGLKEQSFKMPACAESIVATALNCIARGLDTYE
jgi:hypothetical protein